MLTELSITDYQRRVLELPEAINLAVLGGRGGGMYALPQEECYRTGSLPHLRCYRRFGV